MKTESKPTDYNPETGEIDDYIYLPKITFATIGAGQGGKLAAALKKPVRCAEITGMITGVVNKQSKEGQNFIAITGNIEAHNLMEGDRRKFRSNVCYLPGGFHGLVMEQVGDAVQALDRDSRGKVAKDAEARSVHTVGFSMVIDAVPMGHAAGFSYEGRSLLPPMIADPFLALRGHLNAARVALPPPGGNMPLSIVDASVQERLTDAAE